MNRSNSVLNGILTERRQVFCELMAEHARESSLDVLRNDFWSYRIREAMVNRRYRTFVLWRHRAMQA